MWRYFVMQRFGGADIKFFDNRDEAEKYADECLGIVFNQTSVPATVSYDPTWKYDSIALEALLNMCFPDFQIHVE